MCSFEVYLCLFVFICVFSRVYSNKFLPKKDKRKRPPKSRPCGFGRPGAAGLRLRADNDRHYGVRDSAEADSKPFRVFRRPGAASLRFRNNVVAGSRVRSYADLDINSSMSPIMQRGPLMCSISKF